MADGEIRRYPSGRRVPPAKDVIVGYLKTIHDHSPVERAAIAHLLAHCEGTPPSHFMMKARPLMEAVVKAHRSGLPKDIHEDVVRFLAAYPGRGSRLKGTEPLSRKTTVDFTSRQLEAADIAASREVPPVRRGEYIRNVVVEDLRRRGLL